MRSMPFVGNTLTNVAMIDGGPVEALRLDLWARPKMTIDQSTQNLNEPVPNVVLVDALVTTTVHDDIQQAALVAVLHVEASSPCSFINEMIIHPRDMHVISNLL